MHALPYEIDCTSCGCADTEVDREPHPDGWFADGVAHCNDCGQIFSFRAPKETGSTKQGAESQTSVVYTPVLCPSCRSIDVPVQRTAIPVRYHRCRACGTNFKSVEKRK